VQPGDGLLDAEDAQLERRVFATALVLLVTCAWPFVGDIPSRYLALTRALVEERGCAIDSFHADTPDKARRGGHYYLAAAPGPAFAAVPAYGVAWLLGGSVILGLVLATLWVGVLPGALAFRGFYRLSGIAARAPPPTPWRLGCVLALGATCVTPLATVLYASALSVACTVWAAVHACAYRRAVCDPAEGASDPRRHMAWAGFLLAALVTCEYSAAPIALVGAGVLTAWALRASRPADLAAFAAGVAGPALILAAYHTACFGAPWRTGYGFHANPGFAELLAKGVKGYQLPSLHTLYETSLGSARGLLPFAPPVLVGVLVAPRAWKREPRLVLLGLGLGGGYWLLNAMRVSDWYAGFSWGPRYQAHAVACWLLPLLALREPPRWAWRALCGCVALGGAVTALGLGIRWRSTLDASLLEVATFGFQCKLSTLALTGDPYYYPAELPSHTGAALLLGLLAAGLVLAAWGGIWRAGKRGWLTLAGCWLALAVLALIPWSRSMGRGQALRRDLLDREFLSFAVHYPGYANDVRAAEVSLALKRPHDAEWFARRALEADAQGELARLWLAVATDDRAALERLARGAQDAQVRARVSGALGR